MTKDIKEGEESAIRALELLHGHPIGQAVLLNLRNHSEPSKQTLEMDKDTNNRITKYVISFLMMFIAGNAIGYAVNWSAIERGFSGYEAIEARIDGLEEQISKFKIQ